MFMKLKKPIIVMSKYQVTLRFKNSGSVIIEMPVVSKKSNNKIKKHHHH
jgi:copper(I)-binding protein